MEQNLHTFGESQPFAPIKITEQVLDTNRKYEDRFKNARATKEQRKQDMLMSMQFLRDFGAEDFADDSAVFDAMAMSDITGNIHDRLYSTIAKNALREYVMPDKRTEYVFSLLDDINKINRFWQSHDSMSIEQVIEFLETVNLESIIMQSAKSLAFVSNRLPMQNNRVEKMDDSADMWRHVALIQSMLAPICELIGYDGLAMAMHNVTNQATLRRDHQSQFIDMAQSTLDELPDRRGLQLNVNEVINGLVNGDSDNEPAIIGSERHGIIFGHGYMGNRIGQEQRFEGRFVFREKSVGSLAIKYRDYQRKHGQPKVAPDVVGITTISETDEARMDIFRKMVANAGNLDDDGKSVVRIIGSHDFIEHTVPSLDEYRIDELTTIERDDGYQSPRIYIVREGITYEIQAATVDERSRSRYGRNAHTFYKSNLSDQTDAKILEFMAKIHRRREHIGEAELHPATVESGKKLIRDVMSRGGY